MTAQDTDTASESLSRKLVAFHTRTAEFRESSVTHMPTTVAFSGTLAQSQSLVDVDVDTDSPPLTTQVSYEARTVNVKAAAATDIDTSNKDVDVDVRAVHVWHAFAAGTIAHFLVERIAASATSAAAATTNAAPHLHPHSPSPGLGSASAPYNMSNTVSPQSTISNYTGTSNKRPLESTQQHVVRTPGSRSTDVLKRVGYFSSVVAESSRSAVTVMGGAMCTGAMFSSYAYFQQLLEPQHQQNEHEPRIGIDLNSRLAAAAMTGLLCSTVLSLSPISTIRTQSSLSNPLFHMRHMLGSVAYFGTYESIKSRYTSTLLTSNKQQLQGTGTATK
jgi:hypothetical protein